MTTTEDFWFIHDSDNGCVCDQCEQNCNIEEIDDAVYRAEGILKISLEGR